MGRGGWLFGNDAASTRLPQGAATLAGIAVGNVGDQWRVRLIFLLM